MNQRVATGSVTAIRDSMVDVRFADGLPAVRALLVAEGGLRLEVAAHVDEHTVRCLAFGHRRAGARHRRSIDRRDALGDRGS